MTNAALSMPDTRSLLIFQDQLLKGKWADRYLKALSEDTRTVGPLIRLLQALLDPLFVQTSDHANSIP